MNAVVSPSTEACRVWRQALVHAKRPCPHLFFLLVECADARLDRARRTVARFMGVDTPIRELFPPGRLNGPSLAADAALSSEGTGARPES
jgi:hypothetical protein